LQVQDTDISQYSTFRYAEQEAFSSVLTKRKLPNYVLTRVILEQLSKAPYTTISAFYISVQPDSFNYRLIHASLLILKYW